MGTFSDEDCCREGTAGRKTGAVVDGSPGTGVVALGGDFVLPLSDPVLEDSRAENMRVSRLVMDCFSFVGLTLCSECGAAPLAVS